MTDKAPAQARLACRVQPRRAPWESGGGAGFARRQLEEMSAGARDRGLGPDRQRLPDRLYAGGRARRRWTSRCGCVSLAMLISYHRAPQGRLRGREIHSVPRKTLNRAAYHSDLLRPGLGFPARCLLRACDSWPAARAVRDHRDDDGRRRVRLRADSSRRGRLCGHHGRRRDAHADDRGFAGHHRDRADLHLRRCC